MQLKRVRFCYRKIIRNTDASGWERLVWESSLAEYRIQLQLYDTRKQFTLFSELLNANPSANQLHFLVCSAITGYLKQLNEKIPDIQDVLGIRFMKFSNYRFEIIESSRSDPSMHCVAVSFFSIAYDWLETIGDKLLLSTPPEVTTASRETRLFQMPPFTSIFSIEYT